MIEKRPIDTAPKDGTPIYAWDGEWWRNLVRWRPNNSFGAAGWYFQGWLRIEPTHWCPADLACEELLAEIAKGYTPVGSNFSLRKRRSRGAEA